VARIVQSAEIKARFEQLGIEGAGTSPAETARFLEEEIAKWAKVITTAGVKAEQ
jgi:tripartite-type tricarboxylate transporter receptor subunit TctC